MANIKNALDLTFEIMLLVSVCVYRLDFEFSLAAAVFIKQQPANSVAEGCFSGSVVTKDKNVLAPGVEIKTFNPLKITQCHAF